MLRVVIILLLLFLVGGVGSFILIKSGIRPKPAPVKELVSNQIPSPTPDEKLGWKSYQSDKYPVTFRYPPNLVLNEREIRGMDYGVKQLLMLSHTNPFVEIQLLTTTANPQFLVDRIGTKFEKTTINIDGYEETKYYGFTGKAGNVYRELVFFPFGGVMYYFNMNSVEQKDLLDKITSTVKLGKNEVE